MELKSSQGQSTIIYSYLQSNQQSTEGIPSAMRNKRRSSQKKPGYIGAHQGQPLARAHPCPPPMYLPSRHLYPPDNGYHGSGTSQPSLQAFRYHPTGFCLLVSLVSIVRPRCYVTCEALIRRVGGRAAGTCVLSGIGRRRLGGLMSREGIFGG
jgi:hypothetical protein